MPEDIRDYCEKRAEFELMSASKALDEEKRRHHYFQASRYLNILHGGDPRPEGAVGFTY